MEIASFTSIATSTVVATSTAKLNDVPEWFSYTVDIILILVFLFSLQMLRNMTIYTCLLKIYGELLCVRILRLQKRKLSRKQTL